MQQDVASFMLSQIKDGNVEIEAIGLKPYDVGAGITIKMNHYTINKEMIKVLIEISDRYNTSCSIYKQLVATDATGYDVYVDMEALDNGGLLDEDKEK